MKANMTHLNPNNEEDSPEFITTEKKRITSQDSQFSHEKSTPFKQLMDVGIVQASISVDNELPQPCLAEEILEPPNGIKFSFKPLAGSKVDKPLIRQRKRIFS